MTVRVALAGCGRWGSRLLAALLRHPQFQVKLVVDTSAKALARAALIAPAAALENELQWALQRHADGLDAVLIASPTEQHVQHAHCVLSAGLDVFVEKPLALSAEAASGLCRHLHQTNRVGMVGHLLRYHPAVQGIVALAHAGGLGQIRELSGRRMTQSGSPSPLWVLGPHDLSTLHAIDPAAVANVLVRPAKGGVQLDLRLESGTRARFELSTTAVDPARQLLVAGSLRTVDLDELRRCAHPLDRQLDHFAACVRSRTTPLTCFDEGSRVVPPLERAQQQLDLAPSAAAIA